MGADLDEPLGFEAPERFADGYRADVEADGPIAIPNPIAGL